MNLSVKIFLALVLSVIVGLIAGPDALPFIKWWIAPIGTMFINLIKMMIVPVVFTSLIVGMTSIGDTKKLGRIGIKTIGIYLVTTAIAILIGFAVAGAFHPGVGMSMTSDATVDVKPAPSLMQVLVAMIPANPVASMAKADILPIIIFALFVGVGILQVGGERAKILINFFDACAEVCYKIIAMVMAVSPIGVFSCPSSLRTAQPSCCRSSPSSAAWRSARRYTPSASTRRSPASGAATRRSPSSAA